MQKVKIKVEGNVCTRCGKVLEVGKNAWMDEEKQELQCGECAVLDEQGNVKKMEIVNHAAEETKVFTPKMKKNTSKTRFFMMWDKQEKDYAMTMHCDFPVFNVKANCQDIVDLWNKQTKSRRYSVVEVFLTKKDAKKYKK